MLNELIEYPVQTAPKLLATGFLMTSIAMQMNLFRNPERHSKMSAEENLAKLRKMGSFSSRFYTKNSGCC